LKHAGWEREIFNPKITYKLEEWVFEVFTQSSQEKEVKKVTFNLSLKGRILGAILMASISIKNRKSRT
jgi:hypothetical protein